LTFAATTRASARHGDFDATRARFLRHSLCDRAHAPDRVTPHPALPVHFTEAVVQQHVCGALCVGAREITDDRIKPERGLDRCRFEPPVEQVACALRDKVEKIAPRGHVETHQPPAHAERTNDIGDSATNVRRRLEHQRAEHIADAINRVVVGG
jgi:hypothetical protein